MTECFAKLTDNLDTDRFTFQEDAAKTILKFGLQSTDEDVNRKRKTSSRKPVEKRQI